MIYGLYAIRKSNTIWLIFIHKHVLTLFCVYTIFCQQKKILFLCLTSTLKNITCWKNLHIADVKSNMFRLTCHFIDVEIFWLQSKFCRYTLFFFLLFLFFTARQTEISCTGRETWYHYFQTWSPNLFPKSAKITTSIALSDLVTLAICLHKKSSC